MGLMKSLWASVQGNPVFMRQVNGWLTIFWLAMIPVSLVTGWISSVTYVAVLSLWALVSGHWAAWQAARVEVAQQAEIDERLADPIEQRVVDARRRNDEYRTCPRCVEVGRWRPRGRRSLTTVIADWDAADARQPALPEDHGRIVVVNSG